jgi:hypothetical protein
VADAGAVGFHGARVNMQFGRDRLGCKQRIRSAVNDRIGIEPEG